jgi:hypothetical protein
MKKASGGLNPPATAVTHNAQGGKLSSVNRPEANMAGPQGRRTAGKVPIFGQWLGVVVGVLISSAFTLFLAGFIGWSHFRRLWPRRKPSA